MHPLDGSALFHTQRRPRMPSNFLTCAHSVISFFEVAILPFFHCSIGFNAFDSGVSILCASAHEFVHAAGAVVVCHDAQTAQQRFYTGHDSAVSWYGFLSFF
jgi:hypothetical protein